MKAFQNKSGKRFCGFGRIQALILAVLIALCGSFTVLATDSFKTELASEEHNAVREFAPLVEGQSSEYWHYQNLWGYQYAIEFADTESLLNPHWQDCTRYSWNAWLAANSLNYMGMYSNGKMQISNSHKTYTEDSEGNQVSVGYIDKVERAAIAYCFYPDKEGTVEMSGNITENGQGTNSCIYSALIRITVNNTAVYPIDKAWESVKDAESGRSSLSLGGVSFDVSAGDTVRFEMSTDKHMLSGDKLLINWNPNFIFTEKALKYTETNDIYNRLTVFMNSVFRGTEPDLLDSAATDKQKAAEKAVREAQYGLYTPLNAVFASDLLPVDKNSVWKFAAAKCIPAELSAPCENMKLSAEVEAETLNLSWNNSEKISAVKIVLSDGTVKAYTTGFKSVRLNIENKYFPVKIQVTTKNNASEILTVSKTGECDALYGTPLYLNEKMSSASATAGAYFELGHSKLSSKYRFYYSTALADIENRAHRRICFNGTADEEMRFGFTAPYSGSYEISAPLSVKSADGATVKYWLLREKTDGTVTYLQKSTVYSGANEFCNLITELNSGDTVWFCACTDKASEINIGIPTIKLSSLTHQAESDKEYVYRAIDYLETPQKNRNMNYKSSVWTAESTGIWSFGYFSNPVITDGDYTDYDSLKIAEYSVGADASLLENEFTPYELIRPHEGAGIYNTLPASTKISGEKTQIITNTFGVSGNLHPAMGNTFAQRMSMGEIYRCKGLFGKTGLLKSALTGESINIGIFMKYTAPVTGKAELHLSDETSISAGDRLLILKNGKVISVYTGIIPAGETVNLNRLKKGDTVALCYLQVDGESNYGYMGMPYIKMADQWSEVEFNGIEYGKSYDVTSVNGAFIAMPTAEKRVGQRFAGWYDSQASKLFAEGARNIVLSDTQLTAVYNYYGDLNTDGDINSTDLGELKHKIAFDLQNSPEEADLNTDGFVNIIDLVRMKKWLSGELCLLGDSGV